MDLIEKHYSTDKPILGPSHNRFQSFIQTGRLEYSPLWMMRQAGRYLPEYHLSKAKAMNFVQACKNPKIASEITLQPLRRFELDAAIIFSDILLILQSFGYSVSFDGKGPEITCQHSLERVVQYYEDNIDIELDYVGQALEITANQLHSNQTLIGFCGAPWTVALYALDPKRSPLWAEALAFIYKNYDLTLKFFELLSHASMEYLSLQVNSGAQMVMIFDSWLIHAPHRFINNLALESVDKLIHSFKKRHPHIPVIYYPKGKSEFVLERKGHKYFDALAVDNHESLSDLQSKTSLAFQGNFDHRILLTDKKTIEKEVQLFLEALKEPAILNLSHGILKNTPVENVATFVKAIREYSDN